MWKAELCVSCSYLRVHVVSGKRLEKSQDLFLRSAAADLNCIQRGFPFDNIGSLCC